MPFAAVQGSRPAPQAADAAGARHLQVGFGVQRISFVVLLFSSRCILGISKTQISLSYLLAGL